MNIYANLAVLAVAVFFTKWAWEIAITEFKAFTSTSDAMHDDRFLSPPVQSKKSPKSFAIWLVVALIGTFLNGWLLWQLRVYVEWSNPGNF